MKLLIVSALYPPYYRGGYELRCAEVAAGLLRRGHDIHVLTSSYGLAQSSLRPDRHELDAVDGVPIHRVLEQYAYGPKPLLPPWTLTQARRELADARYFLKLLDELAPDVVNWWSMNGLSKILLPIPARYGRPDVHFVEDPWMIREYGRDGELASGFWASLWDGEWGPGVARPLLRRLGRWSERRTDRQGIPTRRLPNRPSHVCFVSRFLQSLYAEAGLAFTSSEVIYGGVSTARFHSRGRLPAESGPLRLLYAGQLSADRGLHTLVEAVATMSAADRARLTLSVAGSGEPEYLARVQAVVREQRLDERIEFLGKIPTGDMPDVYKAHDVLVSPSTRPEGLPLNMVEALLAGCAVLTTGSGGALELASLARLPVFPKNDASALGQLLSTLVTDRSQVRAIATHGQAIALREFGADRMIDRMEVMLSHVADSRRRPS